MTLADSIAEVHLRKATPTLKASTRKLIAEFGRSDFARPRRTLARLMWLARQSGRKRP